MATGKSCSRWFAPVVALLMVFSLSGCFDKEGDQRKAFVDFLQNTAMRSGERLPTLTADQKKQFGPFVSDYAILYGYSQQVNQAMDSGLRPVVDSVNAIRVPQDYMTQLQPLIPAAQIFTQQLVQVGDYIAQQGEQVSFVANGIQFPTSQQASQYNALIGPLASQHQAFNQAWTAAVNATQ